MKKLICLIMVLMLSSTLNILSFSANLLKDESKINEGKLIIARILPIGTSEKEKQMMAMLPTQQTIYFKNGNIRTEGKTDMAITIVIEDTKTGISYTCMDMMGQKIAMKKTKETMNKMKGMMNTGKPEIKLSDETKVIAGIKCKKATITYKERIPPFDVWYTTEIECANSSETMIDGIDGFMMEYKTYQNGMTVSSACTSVERISVPDSLFKIPDGYRIMDMDSMMNHQSRGEH